MQIGFVNSTVERGRLLKLLGSSNDDLIALLKFNTEDGGLGKNLATGANTIGDFGVFGSNPPTTGSGKEQQGAEFVGNSSCYLKYQGTVQKVIGTFSMWFKLTDGDLSETRVIAGFQGNGQLDFSFQLYTNQFRYFSASYGNSVSAPHSLTITGDVWHHIGFTQNGNGTGNWNFYFDGVRYGATSSNLTTSSPPRTYKYADYNEWRLGFGSTNNSGQIHQKNMIIDNARFFTTALSETDMLALYNE